MSAFNARSTRVVTGTHLLVSIDVELTWSLKSTEARFIGLCLDHSRDLGVFITLDLPKFSPVLEGSSANGISNPAPDRESSFATRPAPPARSSNRCHHFGAASPDRCDVRCQGSSYPSGPTARLREISCVQARRS